MSLLLNNLYRFDDFVLDPANRSLARSGTPISLSAKSCQVLTYLVANPGRVVTKDELLKAVWPESFVEESNLPGYISGLRKALGDRSTLITTVPGLGYKFTGVVQTEAPPYPQPSPATASLEVQQLRETTHVVIRESSTTSTVTHTPLFARRAVWASLIVVALIGAAAGFILHRRAEPQQLSKVVVTDFLNLTGDPDFDHVLKSSLELSLAQSPYIQLMGAAEVQSTLGMMQKAPDSPLLGDVALELCRRQNYQSLLRGKIAPGSKWGSYATSLDVVNCITGKTLAELHADAYSKDSVLSTLDGLATRARKAVGESAPSIGQFDVPIQNESTFSFDALQAYNTGSFLGSEGKIVECIPYFQKAIQLDPKFAMAQASLGTAYFTLGDVQKGAQYSKTAFDLRENVSRPERLYLQANYHLMVVRDLDALLQDDQEWTRLYPMDLTGWQQLGYAQIETGDYTAAAETTEHTLQIAGFKYEALYGNLADNDMRIGRFADTKRVAAETVAQNKDTPAIHALLFQIAFLEHDPQSMQREIQWGNTHPEKWIMHETQAILAATAGKEAESESLFKQCFQDAVTEKQPALVDSLTTDEAAVEVDLGDILEANKLLAQVKDHASANWALLSAKAGSTTAADAYLKQPEEYPQGTIDNKVLIPELKAVVALHHNEPQTAITLLEPARPYELAYPEVIDVRAQAFMMAKEPAQAQAEYQKLIDHPAVEEPTLPRTYLAHLGLAQAYALEGRRPESQKEYENFFSLWKEADPNLLALHRARAEYSHL